MSGKTLAAFTPEQIVQIKSLSSPKKIQDFLNTLAKRAGTESHIVRSPKAVLESRRANCIEGALLAAVCLFEQGERPYLLDLKVGVHNKNDVDHVVTLFKRSGYWGAISKTDHAVLRYREPIYKTIRELALSYFHEYFTDDGKKNMRSYSKPFDLIKKFGTDWFASTEDLYEIAAALDETPHAEMLTPEMVRNLRLADEIEITAGKLTTDLLS